MNPKLLDSLYKSICGVCEKVYQEIYKCKKPIVDSKFCKKIGRRFSEKIYGEIYNEVKKKKEEEEQEGNLNQAEQKNSTASTGNKPEENPFALWKDILKRKWRQMIEIAGTNQNFLYKTICGVYEKVYQEIYKCEKPIVDSKFCEELSKNIYEEIYNEVKKKKKKNNKKNLLNKGHTEGNSNLAKQNENLTASTDKKPEENYSALLKNKLERKYRLIQEMIRIAGEIVDLEEFKKQKRDDLYQFIYPKKAEELKQRLEEYEELKQYAIRFEKKTESLKEEEKEFCRLLKMENEDEVLWRTLLEP